MSSNRRTALPTKGSQRSSPYTHRAPAKTGSDGTWLHDRAPGARSSHVAPVNDKPEISNKLLISNLHYEVTTQDLSSIFGVIGTLASEPVIRYDRSGRSTGVAIINFTTAGEAIRAKGQLDGVLAKGKPMTIVFDSRGVKVANGSIPTGPRGASLLNRITDKKSGSLLERLSGAESEPSPGPGPQRTHAPRFTRNKPAAQPPKARAPKAKPKPKTAEDLDKELDAFMGDGETTPSGDVNMGA